jgi:dihydroflavonol-4-reductase
VHAVVTGGAGFIGTHLVRRLVAEGLTVTIVERPGASLDNLSGLDVRLFTADIVRPGSILPVLERCDVLFHLAANPRLWAHDRQEFRRTNTEGTRNVLAAAEAARVPRVVYTSTESILGRARAGRPCDEDTPARVEDMVGTYCLSKFFAELAALEAAGRGLDIVIVNPTLPVGPGDTSRTPPTRLILDFLNGRIPAYMDCTLNVVDVRDVAVGHILAWRQGVRGRRYILGHENMSVRRLLEVVGEISGRRPPRLCVPYALGLAFAHLSEFMADHVTGREPAATVTGVKLTRRMTHLDCSRARRELGFAPGDVRQALADAVAWYHERGWIAQPGPRRMFRAV